MFPSLQSNKPISFNYLPNKLLLSFTNTSNFSIMADFDNVPVVTATVMGSQDDVGGDGGGGGGGGGVGVVGVGVGDDDMLNRAAKRVRGGRRAKEERRFVAGAQIVAAAKPEDLAAPEPDIPPAPKRCTVEVNVSTSNGRPEFPKPRAEVLVNYLIPKRANGLSRMGTHHGKRISEWTPEK